jgi:cytoskeletal protein CcmA (bactofilin family)
MRGRRVRALWILGLVILPLFILVPVALAQSDTVVHLTGEMQGDQYTAGGTVILDEGAVIHGDLLAVGQTIFVYGTVDGSVMAVGNRVDVSGKVGHAVRIAGGADWPFMTPPGGLFVSSDIAGDLIAAGGSLEVRPDARVGGNTHSFANTATLGGKYAGDLQAVGSTVKITGNVEGDAEIECNPCQVADGAVVGGMLTYTSADKAEIRGVVHGAVTQVLPKAEQEVPQTQRFRQNFGWWVSGLLGAWAAGALLLWIFPRGAAAAEQALRLRPGHSVGWGALAFFGVPLVLLTLVGLSLVLGLLARLFPYGASVALALLGLYLFVLFLSQVLVGLTIGRLVLGAFKWDRVRGARFWEMMLGVLLLALAGLIPWVGGWIKFATILFGMGAVTVAWWRSRQRPAAEPLSSEGATVAD